MKKIITKILQFIIDRVKRNKFVQNVFESPFDFEKFEKMGVYKDEYGNEIQLFNGLRTKIRPGWERMLNDKPKQASDVNIQKLKSNSYIAVEKLESILNTLDATIKGSTVLEIGCHSGSTCFAMAEQGAKKVIGTEFNGYKVNAVSNEEVSSDKLNEVSEYLKSLRSRLGAIYQANNISFVDDDICNSKLEPNSFDIVCSWEVLEHLHDPETAFQAISKLLKPGGVSIHFYNPFYCLNGGHSLCTLDFLYGHVRLNDADFVRYIQTYRPKEVEKAVSFYRNGVNRMTLHDLEVALEASGMVTIGVIPFVKEQHLRMVTKEILSQGKKHYPTLQLLDFAAPAITVISKKST